MTQIAKDYKINVYQLTKVCDELEIKRPETEYWSKLRNGYKVKQKSLTEFKTDEYKLVLNLQGSLNGKPGLQNMRID